MEENKENVVEEIIVNQGDPGDEQVEKVDLSKFESADDDSVIKVDLSKPVGNEKPEEVAKSTTDDEGVVGVDDSSDTNKESEEVQPQAETQEQPVLEEVTEEEVQEVTEQVEEAIAEAEETGNPLPENIQKLVDFMEETGGTLEDYVELNKDYKDLDNQTALMEYYKKTKPHLNAEEINFLMEDSFSYDEEVDDEKEVRRKKLALKEQVASAKAYLDGQKSKYYNEIKAGSRLTPEAQKAMDFFNRYNKESEASTKLAERQKQVFNQKTEQVFNNDFKGFEYNVGDKKYRFNVKNAENVKSTQSDINNFINKFVNEEGVIKDAKSYHKALYSANNADAIAQHFYEQGKADALKDSVAKSKNVNMNPRQAHGQVEASGMKFKVLGENSSDFKFKIKNKK
tara:strand:+ start:2388 stop:3581 length:1194 start_codon:yes stop_codon:yes gene_type:complete